MWWAILAVLIWVLAASPAMAQRIIIEPPFPPFPPPVPEMGSPGPIQIDEVLVAAEVDGPAAHVRVTQVFHNRSGQTVEGRFVFPLPANAVVSDLQLKVNDQVLEGRLLPSDEARAIYEQIVRQQRDPALLQYLGQGLFQTNVFPIPPGETRQVQFQYTQLVEQRDGLFHFRYPLRGQAQGGAQFELTLELTNQPGLRTLYSPNREAQIERGASDAATVRLAGDLSKMDPAFDLYWGVADEAIGVNLLSYRPTGEDGFFVLLASPALESAETEVVARDMVLVLDVSGSMEGEKIDQARRAADFVLDQLNPDDRFNIVAFSTGVHLWSGDLQAVSADAIDEAHAWVTRLDAGGSTDINRALLEALAQLSGAQAEAAARPAYVLFMTDGLPTQGETDPWRILDNAQLNKPEGRTLRLFTFGVGYDVDTQLLDTLSAELGGRSSYVLPEERIDEAVSAFYQGIQTPVLTEVEIDFGDGVTVDEVYPYPLPDLFAGEQLVVAGRYRAGGTLPVTLRGTVNGVPYVFEYPNQELVERGGEPFVARLWASRKIGVLMAEVRRNGPSPELVDAIVDLSLQYGIVTPYTAYLAEEPQSQVGGGAVRPDLPVLPGMDGGGAPADARQAAEAYAAGEAARMAEMPASGAPAVTASQAQNELQTASTVAGAEAMLHVAGKTFVRQGTVTGATGDTLPFWVDAAYTSDMTLRTVLFGSDEYFNLAQDAAVAAWLSVGPEMVVVLPEQGGVRVTTVGAPTEPPAPVSPLATPDSPAAEESSGGWGGFWLWLWNEVVP
ncbi:MAG: VWA domain-containing protein [Caldilineaceae bacterium]|nr:VWA domain-containing protein [Caldilineaceae bacterium]